MDAVTSPTADGKVVASGIRPVQLVGPRRNWLKIGTIVVDISVRNWSEIGQNWKEIDI